MIFEKEKTCAFTGHRILGGDFDENKLLSVVTELIGRGYDTFLVGMAIGFDTACYKLLEFLRGKFKIRLIACIPCEQQDLKFDIKQKTEYRKMLASADEKIYVSKEYTKTCMFKRNMFMVDNASVLIAYLKNDKGGTYNTVKYAERKGVNIIMIN